jgi:t-SNARE complex subunit (syntaxin)
MGSSNNTLNTALKKMGRIDKITLFNVLITVMILVCYFLVITYQEF